jgi:hypothetical protein
MGGNTATTDRCHRQPTCSVRSTYSTGRRSATASDPWSSSYSSRRLEAKPPRQGTGIYDSVGSLCRQLSRKTIPNQQNIRTQYVIDGDATEGLPPGEYKIEWRLDEEGPGALTAEAILSVADPFPTGARGCPSMSFRRAIPSRRHVMKPELPRRASGKPLALGSSRTPGRF